jgi:hypothetical protein
MKIKLKNIEEQTQFEHRNGWFIIISQVMPNVYGCLKLHDDMSINDEEQEFYEFDGNTLVELV